VKREIEIDVGPIRLRPLREGDLVETLRWRNRSREQFASTEEIAPSTHSRWFSEYLLRDDDFVWVGELEDGTIASQVSIYQIGNGSAQFGRLLVAPELRRRGLGIYTLLGAVVMARLLNVRKLWLSVKRDNARAIKIYEICGFHPFRQTNEIVLMERWL